jgi:hypothetical protein
MRYLVLLAPVLLACATRHHVREQRPLVNNGAVLLGGPALVIDSAECYTLTYDNSRNGASERFFPVWIALMPGKYGAGAESKHNPSLSDTEWAAVSEFHGWRQISTDSIEVRFTGAFEGMSIRIPRNSEKIQGRAIWLTDAIGLPEASMRVTGLRQTCPAEILSAKSG